MREEGRVGQGRVGQGRAGQVKLGQVRSGQVTSSSDQVKSNQIRVFAEEGPENIYRSEEEKGQTAKAHDRSR